MIVTKIDNPKKSGSKSERVNGLADYITAPENKNQLEKCIHSECENFITDNFNSQKMEMLALAEGAIKSKDTIDHWVISWQPHERPTIEQARQSVETFIKHTGLDGHQHIWGLHDDTKAMHVHISVNRVNPDTLKVTKINKGFWKEAGQQVACLIEHEQGWQGVPGARYQIEKGKLKKLDEAERKAKPDSVAEAKEIQTGEKSAQRIGIESAAPIIAAAKSWRELHTGLAAIGMRYEREGSGAKVYVDDIGIKASDVDRKAGFGALQKRLGQFQQAKEIKPNEYHHHTPQPHLAQNGSLTANNMRSLSKCNLAHSDKGEYGKTKRAGVLQFDARSDRQRTRGVRRDAGRSAGSTGVALKPDQPGWKEYAAIRAERTAGKSTATLELRERHDAERKALAEEQKAVRQRDIYSVKWNGRGTERNTFVSSTATLQAAEKLELQAQHKAEREALQARFAPLPQYKAWAGQDRIVEPLIQVREAQHVTSKLAETLRSLDRSVASNGHITYKSAGHAVFRDEGRSIKVLDTRSDAGIAAALATAQQKFGRNLTLTGSPEFQQKAVAVAVANGLSCRFTDPAMDKLREQLQAQKYQAERDHIGRQRTAERDAAEQRRQMKERETVQAKAKAVQEPFTSKPLTPAQPSPVPSQTEAPDLDRIFNTYLPPAGSENAQYAADLTTRADAKKADQQPSHVTPDMFTGQITVEQMKVLDKELDRLQTVAKGAALAIKDNQPRPADELTPAQIDALGIQLSKLSINIEAKQKWPDAAPAFPENQYQGDHWQNAATVSQQQLADHIKTDRPLFKNKEWDQTKERLETEASNWKGGIEWRQKRLEALKPAKVAEAIKLHATAQQEAAAKRTDNFKSAAHKLHQVEQQIEATGTALFSQPEPLQRELKQVRELEHQQELEKARQLGMSRGR